MAENKKSFVLYNDLIETVKKLPDDKKWQLFQHILEYVNDLDPKTDDLLIEIAFEPIKQSLKRDLKKREKKTEQRSNSWRLWNLKRRNPDLYDKVAKEEMGLDEAESIAKDRIAIKPIANIAVSDSVSVSVSDSVINKKELFREYRDIYPNKKWKAKAEEWYIKHIKKKENHLSIMKWVRWYIQDHEKKTRQWVFCPEYRQWDVFLNKKTWMDYSEQVIVQKKKLSSAEHNAKVLASFQ